MYPRTLANFTHLKAMNVGSSFPVLESAATMNKDIARTHMSMQEHMGTACHTASVKVGSDNGLSPAQRQAIIWNQREVI